MRFRDPFCVDPITRHRIFYFLDAVVRHLGFLELKFLTATHFGYMFYIILPNLVIYRQQAKQTGKQKHYYSAADRIRTVYEAARPNAFELPRLPLLLEASWPPSDACFLEPTQLHVPNDISIGTTVFARLNNMSERHTERQTQRPQGSHRPQTLPPVLL